MKRKLVYTEKAETDGVAKAGDEVKHLPAADVAYLEAHAYVRPIETPDAPEKPAAKSDEPITANAAMASPKKVGA